MKLLAESDLFTSSATYSVNDIVESWVPSLDAQACSTIRLSFGDSGIKPTDGVINAWVMMAPTQWKDKTITTKLYAARNNVPTEYVTEFCEAAHGKTPVIGWNMFWGYNGNASKDYDTGANGALEMYYAIVQAAKDMIADNTKATDIKLIIPSGTAIQNARGTSLNDPGSPESPSPTQLLTNDGIHASYGIGRYTTACTWFQYLIAPIYGVSIEGNTYRPTNKSFDKDLVTDERAALCWKCAIEAVKHPFEVTPIEE